MNELKIKKRSVETISKIEDGYVIKVGGRYIYLSPEAKIVWDICDRVKNIEGIINELAKHNYTNVKKSSVASTLMMLKSKKLIEIQSDTTIYSAYSSKKTSIYRIRPIVKWRAFKGRKLLKIFKPLCFLANEKYLIISYLIPWIIFISYLIKNKINIFLSLLSMNYVIIMLTFPILVLHEFAHAVVSEKLGARIKGFGIGIYKIVPFFYTDTSNTLLLKRKDRIKVSLAGPAINFLAGLFFLGMAIFFKSKELLNFSGLLYLFGLNSLIPIFESDGYYALTDYAMVNNLKREVFRYLKSIFKRTPKKNLLKKQAIIFTIYPIFYVYSVFLTIYFLLYFFPVYIKRLIFYSHNIFLLNLSELTSFVFALIYIILITLLLIKYAWSFIARFRKRQIHRRHRKRRK